MGVAKGDLILALFGVGWVILAIWLLAITINVRKLANRQKIIAKAGEDGDFVRVISDSLKELSTLKSDVAEIKDDRATSKLVMDTAVRNVGMVRFDAFDDVGGKLSFAVALLDSNGDGVVISAINGRQESRSYAKHVRNGDSSYILSAEERDAITKALSNDRVNV
ncbi:MAG TPA: DUF4446 family protein [Anaerolineae bacterium]|nr:DUF4446 family protein [Anaerolineae bacterium]